MADLPNQTPIGEGSIGHTNEAPNSTSEEPDGLPGSVDIPVPATPNQPTLNSASLVQPTDIAAAPVLLAPVPVAALIPIPALPLQQIQDISPLAGSLHGFSQLR